MKIPLSKLESRDKSCNVMIRYYVLYCVHSQLTINSPNTDTVYVQKIWSILAYILFCFWLLLLEDFQQASNLPGYMRSLIVKCVNDSIRFIFLLIDDPFFLRVDRKLIIFKLVLYSWSSFSRLLIYSLAFGQMGGIWTPWCDVSVCKSCFLRLVSKALPWLFSIY